MGDELLFRERLEHLLKEAVKDILELGLLTSAGDPGSRSQLAHDLEVLGLLNLIFDFLLLLLLLFLTCVFVFTDEEFEVLDHLLSELCLRDVDQSGGLALLLLVLGVLALASFIIVAFFVTALISLGLARALLFRFVGALALLVVGCGLGGAFLAAKLVPASRGFAGLFALNFLLGLQLGIFVGGLFPSGLPVLEHVLDQELEALRGNHLRAVSVHELVEALIHLSFLLGALGFLTAADALLQLISDFVDQVERCFEGVFIGDGFVQSQQAAKALEDDHLSEEVLTVQLTHKVDVSEEALLVSQTRLFVVLAFDRLVLGKDTLELFTALLEELSAEVAVLDVAPHCWVALHFKLEP